MERIQKCRTDEFSFTGQEVVGYNTFNVFSISARMYLRTKYILCIGLSTEKRRFKARLLFHN